VAEVENFKTRARGRGRPERGSEGRERRKEKERRKEGKRGKEAECPIE
jgi:hypothetical protein